MLRQLRVLGIDKGDAVGIHLADDPETVVALLAINRIGAIAVRSFRVMASMRSPADMDAVGAKAYLLATGFRVAERID